MSTPLPPPAEEFVSWLVVERGRAASTVASYRRDLAGYVAFLDASGVELSAASTADVEGYLAAVQRAPRAPATVARLASTLRGLYGFLLDEGVVDADPTAGLAARRSTTRLPVVLSEPQVAALLASPCTDEPADVRDRAVLEFLYGTGVRVSELVGLDVGDVDFDEALVRVTGKGSKQRLVPLGRGADAALRAWLHGGARTAMLAPAGAKGEHRAVFCNHRGRRLTRQGVDLVVRRHARRLGLPGATSAHTLRHSCATHMLARGADVRVIQELLGHASVGTTQRYTKVAPAHLVEAYRAAHPRAGDVPSTT
ncbi:MAG TPA: tyrosine recombinase [Acidimicrobiales bacterium]|nr:tyrosine recombinase [Acidimicrobiales bacterium]